MTIAERNNKLKHFITCLKCEVSGKPCNVNCSTQYDTGNMGEIIENLEAISKALKQEPKWIPVSERFPDLNEFTGSRVWQRKVLITGYLSFDDTKDIFVSEAFAKDVICNSVQDIVVIAWMPLPKPYEPQEGEEL